MQFGSPTDFGYGGNSWKPPLFKIGKLPIRVTGLVVLLQIIGMLVVVALPELTMSLAVFDPVQVRGGAVWQVVTYPFFVPPSVWLVFGLFFFYSFGSRVEDALSRSSYVKLLFSAMLIPPVVVFAASLLRVQGSLVGSGLPHLAIFVAAVAMFPNAPLALFHIPIKWLAVVFVVVGLLQDLMARNWGGALALVAVVAFALRWMNREGLGSAWGVREDLLGPRSSRPARSRKKIRTAKVTRTYETKLKPRAASGRPRRPDIDRILDKINEEGLHSLTEEERKILQEASRK